MPATIKGMPQLRARISGLSKARKTMARTWALQTTKLAKQNFRPHKKTGTTSRTIAPRNVSEHGAEVSAGAAAVFIEGGTRAHDIRPKRARALRFATGSGVRLSGRPRKGAGVVFAKRVHHPGTKADPFLEPAAKEALGDVGVKVLVDGWNRAA